ncbi:MAG: alpha/beta hydrolase [Alteromonadaceae bacterium]|uniref:alpha/beta fold hydrolase n=1 Tax=Paraglaciecola chathamensis TaxID=368405 RepID=UPI000C665445|nr:alpha/beta fold hydrolase [Paraglaciecola agarilytica]MBN24049.1 alpha/beta hydrolase [Alteromonadaceae bacterium]
MHHRIDRAAENQPWLLLIHGLFGSLDNLAMLRRQLNKEFNIVSIDLPDHGKSQHSEQFSFPAYAQSVIHLLSTLEITKIHLVGHSLGGKIAMQMALSQPDLITTLTVLDIAPVTYEPRHENVFKSLLSVNLTEIDDRKDADKQMSEFVSEASVRQFLLKSLYQDNDSGHWHWRFNLALLDRDYPILSKGIDSEQKFSKPVLFLKGEKSDYLKASYTKQTTELFPDSRVRVISSVGHWLHAEKPSECAKHIRTFLLN